jgi:diamine N-acetyltransferase
MASGDGTQHIDKMGCPFEVRECGDEHGAALTEMYDGFSPKGESQGLPPADDDERRHWVEKLLAGARNFVARQDGKVVGHSALIPDLDRRDGEYIIFVSREYRNRGLGAALTAMAADTARELGLNRIWLTVEAYNFRAIKLYRQTGFVFLDHGDRERIMALQL